MFQNPELLIEKEFNDLVYEDVDSTRIQTPFLYRRNKRDRYNLPLYCQACNANKSGVKEGSQDCPYCLGTGTQWEQGIHSGWFSKNTFSIERTLNASIPDRMADSSFVKIFLYTDSDFILKDTDVVLIPKLTSNGSIEIPVVSEGIFLVYEDYNFRSMSKDSDYNRYKLSTAFDSTFRSLLDD